ncbi:hypothetical protein HJ581_0045655 [Rhodococcus opacus]|nr:hypothetical protein HJ581_0045655 [Rhodococcus opacus]
MRTTTWMPAAVLATAVLLAGCSNADTTAEPTGKSGGDQTATASVDPAALDTGSYPTSPAPSSGGPPRKPSSTSTGSGSPSSPSFPSRSTRN